MDAFINIVKELFIGLFSGLSKNKPMIKGRLKLLFSRKISEPNLIEQLNKHEIKINDTVIFKGKIYPFAFTKKPRSLFATQLKASRGTQNIKEKGFNLESFASKLPLKFFDQLVDKNKRIAFLYIHDDCLEFESLFENGKYKLIPKDGSKYIPILISQELYNEYVGRNITICATLKEMEDDMLDILNRGIDDIEREIKSYFYTISTMTYFQAVYLDVDYAKLNKELENNEKNNRQVTVCECIEFMFLEPSDVTKEIKRIMAKDYISKGISSIAYNDGTVNFLLEKPYSLVLYEDYLGFYSYYNFQHGENNDNVEIFETYKAVLKFLEATKLDIGLNFCSNHRLEKQIEDLLKVKASGNEKQFKKSFNEVYNQYVK